MFLNIQIGLSRWGAVDLIFAQIALALLNPPQRQIGARLTHAQALRQCMFVGVLQVLHDEQVTVVQGHKPFLLRGAVSDYEVPRGSKAHAGDARRINFGFVVAVPSHGVLAVSVLIEEAGIEVTAGLSVDFHLLHKLTHLCRERSSRPLYARIPISRAHPSRESRLGVRLAVHPNAVLLPRNGFRPMDQRYFVKCSADDPAGAGTFSQ